MRCYVYAAAVAAALLLSLVAAAQTSSWRGKLELPVRDAAGNLLDAADIESIRVIYGPSPSNLNANKLFSASAANDLYVDGLPDSGSTYFAASVIAKSGVPSQLSNVACFTFSGAQCVPGPFETDVTAVSFRDAVPVTSWSRSFSFRATAGYVVDPPNTTPVFGGTWQPRTETRDRSRNVDVRLAGINALTSTNAAATATFPVTLPAPGRYRVRLAAGDAVYDQYASWEIRDGALTLARQAPTVVRGGSFMDAMGLPRTAAQWPTANQPRDLLFTTTSFNLVLFRPPANSAVMATLSLERLP